MKLPDWIEPSVHLYTVARNKAHGSGKAPRRQALMLAIMGFNIVHQRNRFCMWSFSWLMPVLLRVLYVKARVPCR